MTIATKEPAIAAGTTAQFWRGDKTWQPLPAAPVTSVAGRTGTVVLAKADVGLGSVDNTSDAAKPVSAAQAAADDSVAAQAAASRDGMT